MMALGKIQLNLPSLDIIDTYIFQNKKVVHQAKPKKIAETASNNIQQKPQEKPQGSVNSENSLKENSLNPSDAIPPSNVEQSNNVQTTQPTIVISKTNPFTRFINETMKFDIYWMGIYVGSAIVYVKGNENEITITSMVKSAGFISNFYYVNDRAESKIEDGKPTYFALVQNEGKYKGNKETIFDHNNKEIIFINNLKNNTTYHKNIDKMFMDVLSGFFYLRTLPIKLNEPVSLDIFDSNKFTTVQIQPIKEEKIELSDNKQIDAILIKPKLNTEGLFKRKGDILIWLSKDDKKIPLKIETRVPVGHVVAELKEYKNE